MELAQGEIGPEVKYEAKFEGGKLHLELDYGGAQAKGSIVLDLDAAVIVKALGDKLAAAIPGQIDDLIIAAIESAVLK